MNAGWEFLYTLSPEFRVSNVRPGRRCGVLTPVASTILSTFPDGSIYLDMTTSGDGRYLHTLNSSSGTIGVYSINSNGSLTELGDIEGLPQTAGFNGIAALLIKCILQGASAHSSLGVRWHLPLAAVHR
jgi:hypothetical protein